MKFGQPKVATTERGVELTVPRHVGPDVKLELTGNSGPKLLTDLMRGLEPHFPRGDDRTPDAVVMTLRGISWKAGVSSDQSKDVFVTVRHPEIPGILLQLTPQQSKALGEALINLATAAETSDARN